MTSDLGPLLASGNVAEVYAWRDACRGAAPADACRSHVPLERHAAPFAASYLERYYGAARCVADEVLA